MPGLIIGSQWGDEGKGKVTDYYSEKADYVVRFQGGANAGHAVVVDGKKYKFHLIPSGSVYEKRLVLGNGTVIDPELLLKEIEELKNSGKDVDLYISDKAHVIFPFHKEMDALQEKTKKKKIGTTMRGIGPAYMDKAGRTGIRVSDLVKEERLKEKLKTLTEMKNDYFDLYEHEIHFDPEKLFDEYKEYGKKLKKYVTDTSLLLNEAITQGKKILLEGAQGTLLDIDHGTYPYCTSSNTTAGGACTGTGISPKHIKEILGVMKAYTTRVGSGPMPSEINDEIGDFIRERGQEYGTTTGRPRRVGWLDLIPVKYSHLLNNFTGLAITKLDVLSGLEKVKICVSYKYENEILDKYPSDPEIFDRCEPVYKEFTGWEEFDPLETTERGFESLPENAKNYIKFVSEEINVPVYLVSIGPGRKETLVLREIFNL